MLNVKVIICIIIELNPKSDLILLLPNDNCFLSNFKKRQNRMRTNESILFISQQRLDRTVSQQQLYVKLRDLKDYFLDAYSFNFIARKAG